MTLTELAEKMRGIDFTMFSTKTDDGQIAARPMSNNGDVEYDGDSWFFTNQNTRLVRDIEHDATVELSFCGEKGLFGKPGIFVAVQGQAQLIRDKQMFAKHWAKDLERYFAGGIDTPGLVLINVHATRIHYWDGEENGEVSVGA